MKKRCKTGMKADRGQSLAEYGLILALVAIVAISGLTILGESISDQFNGLASTIDSANTSGGGCSNCGGAW